MIGRSRYFPRSVDDVSIKRVMVFDGDVFEEIFFCLLLHQQLNIATIATLSGEVSRAVAASGSLSISLDRSCLTCSDYVDSSFLLAFLF